MVSIRFNRRKFAIAGGAMSVLAAATAACQAAPPPATATVAPQAAGASKLFLEVDMVQGSANIPSDQAATKSCVMNNRFPRNGEIVWRTRIFDGKTGDTMDNKAVSKASVILANGTTLDMQYGGHPAKTPKDFYWTVNWLVPRDQATGTLNYKVDATASDGRTGEFVPFNSAPSLLTITDEVYDIIPTPAPAAAAPSPTK